MGKSSRTGAFASRDATRHRRQQTFFGDTDYALYPALLAQWCAKAGVEIWAYGLRPNQVHLIATPPDERGLAAAVDAGLLAGAPEFDITGAPRPPDGGHGMAVDLGAYELQPAGLVPVITSALAVRAQPASRCPIRLQPPARRSSPSALRHCLRA